MKFVYLDKRDRVQAWFTQARKTVLVAAAIIFSLLPLWHESAVGRFVLEPASLSVLRALVPGTVTRVYADEGEYVEAGAPIVQLRNVPLNSKLAGSRSELEMAAHKANSTLLRYADYGSAEKDRDRLGQQTRDFTSEVDNLELKTPIAGQVTTPRVSDKVGSYVVEGTELAEVADLSRLRARIYISEFEMYKFGPDSAARLLVDGMWGKRGARTVAIEPMSSDIAPALIDLSKFKGQRPPRFYVFELLVENMTASMRPGMTGTARLYGRRRSLAGLGTQWVRDFFGRKFW